MKLKYRRSFLGYVWSVLNPLLIMLVMTVVFSTMFQRKITNYPVYLITGRTLFEFYSTSTKAAMRSILGNGTLLKKTYVPKYIFPLAKVTSSLVDCFFSLGAMLIVIVCTKAKISWYLLLSPIILVQIYIFSLGAGFSCQRSMYFSVICSIFGKCSCRCSSMQRYYLSSVAGN